MADHWLVRTKENLIAGPYTGDQIKELVLAGQLGYQDEICKANGYWIYLHERQEVKNFLGIDVPKPGKDPDEEITETQTENILEMESSLGAMPEDSTRVGTMIARKKPGAASAESDPAPAVETAPQPPARTAAPAPRPSSPSPQLSPGVLNGNGAQKAAASKDSPNRQKLLFVAAAAGVTAILILFRYLIT